VFFGNFLISGSATVVLSTLEKEFFLSSVKSGLFLGVFEVAGFLAAPLFGFLASFKRVNKMKLLSLALLLFTIGAYMIGLLVFFKDPYTEEFLINGNETVRQENANPCASRTTRFGLFKLEEVELELNENVEVFLYFGQAMIGFGAVVIYSIGIAYVEEITLKEQSSYCQAIFYGSGKQKRELIKKLGVNKVHQNKGVWAEGWLF
jgi:MFS family permease